MDTNNNREEGINNALCALRLPDTLSIHLFNGNSHDVTLPFHADRISPLSRGVIIQQAEGLLDAPFDGEGQEEKVPTLFSLSHPFDDPRPIVLEEGDGVNGALMCSEEEKLIKTIEEPQLMVTFNRSSGKHTVWQFLELENQETEDTVPTAIGTSLQPMNEHSSRPSVGNSAGILSSATSSYGADSSMSYTFLGSPNGVGSPLSVYGNTGYNGASTATRQDMLASLLTGQQLGSFGSPSLLGLEGSMSMNATRGCPSQVSSSSSQSPSPIFPELSLRKIWEQGEDSIGGTEEDMEKNVAATDVFVCNDGDSSKTVLCLVYGGYLWGLRLETKEETLVAWMEFRLPCLSAVALSPLRDKSTSEHKAAPVFFVAMTPAQDLILYYRDHPIDIFTLPSSVNRASITGVIEGCGDLVTLVLKEGDGDQAQQRFLRCRVPLRPESPLVQAVFDALQAAMPLHIVLVLLGDVATMMQKHRASLTAASVLDAEWETFVCIIDFLLDFTDQGGGCKDAEPDPGSASAWEAMLATPFHRSFENENPECFPQAFTEKTPETHSTRFNLDLSELGSVPEDFMAKFKEFWTALHLVYEDCQLDYLRQGWVEPLGTLLLRIALKQGDSCTDFAQHYLKSQKHGTQLVQSTPPSKAPVYRPWEKVPCFFSWIQWRLESGTCTPEENQQDFGNQDYGGPQDAFPILPGSILQKLQRIYNTICSSSEDSIKGGSLTGSTVEAVILTMIKEGFDSLMLSRIPEGFSLPLQEALHLASLHAPPGWPIEAYTLIGREDLAANASFQQFREKKDGDSTLNEKSPSPTSEHASAVSSSFREDCPHFPNDDNGFELLEYQTRLRFGKDYRVHEACRLLCSSKPVLLKLQRSPEVSDHEHQVRLQDRLHLICKRTVATAVGRGMLTLGTLQPLLAEPLPVPPLCLAGRLPPAQGGSVLHLDLSSGPEEMTLWPQFHNGVAAGLRLVEGLSTINRTWIVYNRPPAAEGPASFSHGGLLMALGLRGHLKALAMTDVYDYLTQSQESYLVGLLVGMACSKRGTADPQVSKMLCLHLPSLLPPPFADVDLSAACQTAAIQGVGLLYMGTTHRLMTEFLLKEIGRPPVGENFQDREAYSLSAALSVGLVNLGKGRKSPGSSVTGLAGLADLKLRERLHTYIKGGKILRPKVPDETCSRLLEGDQVNISLTATGAILALGLVYLKSGDPSVAQLLELPTTAYALGAMRPDLLMYRTISHGLVMWDQTKPTQEWVKNQIPAVLEKAFQEVQSTEELDWQSVRQNHANIIAGACFAIGLCFAGTADPTAFETLIHFLKRFRTFKERDPRRPERPVLEMCLGTVALALGMVMSGTGNLQALKTLREIRSRVDKDLTYGHHMAVTMAIGLLFLGGGNCALGRTDEAVGALVVALFPRFPSHSYDNQYHLQALRHLYVLAVEERGLETEDIRTGDQVFCPIQVTLQDGQTLSLVAPCLLPDPRVIASLELQSPRYHAVSMACSLGCRPPRKLYVKLKSGELSYAQDPQALSALVLRPFPPKPAGAGLAELIAPFTADPQVTEFVKHWCLDTAHHNKKSSADSNNASEAQKFQKFCTGVLYECLTDEKPQMMGPYIRIYQLLQEGNLGDHPLQAQNLQLVSQYYQPISPILKKLKAQVRSLHGEQLPLYQKHFVFSIVVALNQMQVQQTATAR